MDRPLPADFRRALWWRARWMPVVAKRSPFAPLLRRYTPPIGRRWALDVDSVLDAVKAVVARPRRMRGRRCLREGLLAYSFLRECGYAPVMRFGVDGASLTGPRLRAHLWVDLDGRTILNPPQPGFVEVYRYADLDDLPRGSERANLASAVS